MYQTIQKKTHVLLHPELGHSKWDKIINGVIISLIILNVIAVILETVPEIYQPFHTEFHYFDLFSITVFSVEYILRVWSATVEARYKHPVKGRLKYMFTAGAMIDLLAILPSFLHSFIGLDLRVLRILRLARFLRLFRLTSYMKSTKMVVDVFRLRVNELVLSFILAVFLIIISSSIMYFAEHQAQPKEFKSIPHAIYWSVITLTTTGYGDVVPKTTIGRFMTGILILIGVGIFALPAGIITAGFLEEFRKAKSGRIRCPHCGELLPDHFHSDHHGSDVDQTEVKKT
ncbi:MAG TPA: ion transporter [Chitinophagaceae bacterium]|nr:ion transporter [Chitinophagaceae bacterium]